MNDETREAIVEQACEIMHNAYEAAALAEGWGTQARSNKPWADVPEANKATMRAAVRALLASPALDAVVAERVAALAEEAIARLGKYRTGLDSTIFVLQEHQLRAALRERGQTDE